VVSNAGALGTLGMRSILTRWFWKELVSTSKQG
jgi:hypothetical protein